MYELISQQLPFYDVIGSKASLADQLITDGKRPRLSSRVCIYTYSIYSRSFNGSSRDEFALKLRRRTWLRPALLYTV